MPDHLGRNRRFVDEDEARRDKPGLLDPQLGTRRSDIRTILFGGVAVAPKDDLAQVRLPLLSSLCIPSCQTSTSPGRAMLFNA